MNKCKLHIITFLALFIAGCNPQPEAKQLLQQAGRLVDAHPDSAMHLIDSIFYPDRSLNRKQYMEFIVMQVQAKYKTHRSVAEDTLIHEATGYFEKKGKDPAQIALAYFYSGCVLRQRQQYDKAMQHYKNAEQFASNAGDIDLKGLVQYNMGDLLAGQRSYHEALIHYGDATQLYRQKPDRQVQCLSAMGRMHLLMGQPDSAFSYFHEGLKIAESVGDNKLQSLLAQNLSVTYADAKQYIQAEKFLQQSYRLNRESSRLPRYYLNFAKLYAGMERSDSAAWYTDQLKLQIHSVEDDYFKASAYAYLANWEKSRGNYDAAFTYLEMRMKVLSQLMEKEDRQSVYEVHRKYDYEQLQKKYYMDLWNRQRWISVLLAAIMTGGTLSTWYWLRQRNKHMEVERNIETLQQMNRNLEDTISIQQTELQKNIMWRFDVARKVMDMNDEIKKPGGAGFKGSHWIVQFNKIVYGRENIQKTWEALFDTFQEARPGLSEKIRKIYPTLTDTEFYVCILTYAGFSVDEAALILNLSPHTVQSRRGNIRQKMDLGRGGDIAAHIDKL